MTVTVVFAPRRVAGCAGQRDGAGLQTAGHAVRSAALLRLPPAGHRQQLHRRQPPERRRHGNHTGGR